MIQIPFLAMPIAIPSPPQNQWNLGPLPLRAYAIFILCGIFIAWWLSSKRYAAKGGDKENVADAALAMVILGIVGARLFAVVTAPQMYFGAGKNPLSALYIWEGGLAIMGGVLGGALGAWIVLRRKGLRLGAFADAVAPGLLLGQVIGRLGNYFNQELFGGPTNLPWGLKIDVAHLPPGYAPGTLFHPTFLYEMLWNLAALAVILWLEKRYHLVNGQVFWIYVMLYNLGRIWIEMVRIDPSSYILGLRLYVWFAILLFILGYAMFMRTKYQQFQRKANGQPEDIGIFIDA